MRENLKMLDVKWRFYNIICFEHSVWNVTSDLTYQPHCTGLLTSFPFSVVDVVRYL
jgi:hypothetical protein